MTAKVSVAIITKNEEENIRSCLESVRWADEVVVVDSGSSDATLAICREFGCRVFETPWLGFARTKQLAVDNCRYEWVLVLDADEVVSAQLQAVIPSIITDSKFSSFCIKINSFYLGKKIRHSGWNRVYPRRLFLKDKGRYNNKMVHESFIMQEGATGRVCEPILHYTYPRVSVHIKKMVVYAKLGAEQQYKNGKRSNLFMPLVSGLFKFIKMYIIKAGILDGTAGLVLALNSAFGAYLKYLYLWEAGLKKQGVRTDKSTGIKNIYPE